MSNHLNDTDTAILAMPAIVRPFMRCTIYVVRALVLLALLAEAYSFIAPSSYIAAYNALWNHLDEGGILWLILGALKEVARFYFKLASFCIGVEIAVLIFGGRCGTVNADSPREWGTVVYFKRRRRVFAFRFAIRRNFWVARWCIWSGNVLDGIVQLLIELTDKIRNWGASD